MTDRADLRGPLASRLAPVLAVVASIVALSAPLAYHWMGCAELREGAARDAARIAEDLAREAEERPLLWRYDTIRLLTHLRAYQGRVARIEVLDGDGVPLDPAAAGELPDVLWASAPIRARGAITGAVWVAMDPAPLRARSLGLLALFAVLAIGLVAAVRAIVMRSAAGAESRIDELVDRLAAARSEQRVRAIGARAVSAQEEERRAIARDLHDSVGQGLTAIRIQAELLRATDAPSAAAERAAKKIADTSDATIEEVRRAIARLGPAVLDELGLSRAVARLIEDAKENASISIESRLDGAEGLSAALESTCYRIVQEALTNVARHAGARTARVTITREGDDVVVEIEDDGRGAEPTGDAGHGLRAMRERAELLGGTLEIARDGGTKVRAVLPLRS